MSNPIKISHVAYIPVQLYRGIIATVAIATIIILLGACNGNTTSSEETARNIFRGVADGIPFSTTGIITIKDTANSFLLLGSMPGSGSILAAFSGTEEKEYPLAEEGSLYELTVYLNELIAADSFFIDTAVLQELFADSANLIPEETSFIYFISEDVPYFSTRGNITLSIFDGTINRISGTIEGEFTNAAGGPKYINTVFEDLFYLDCPNLTNCRQ